MHTTELTQAQIHTRLRAKVVCARAARRYGEHQLIASLHAEIDQLLDQLARTEARANG